jgi:hypothetical protein
MDSGITLKRTPCNVCTNMYHHTESLGEKQNTRAQNNVSARRYRILALHAECIHI